MPAAFAKYSSSELPVSQALAIIIIAREIAVPPPWASSPSEDKAAATPKISASVMPTCEPAAEILSAI